MAKKQPDDEFLRRMHADIDDCLREIGVRRRELAVIETKLNLDLEAARARHQAEMDAALQALTEAETRLRAVARGGRKWLFAEAERVHLPHGMVMLKSQWVVNRGRMVLAAIEQAGRIDLLKIAKAVDWDKLEKLPDDELTAFGTYRKEKAEVEYELAT